MEPKLKTVITCKCGVSKVWPHTKEGDKLYIGDRIEIADFEVLHFKCNEEYPAKQVLKIQGGA